MATIASLIVDVLANTAKLEQDVKRVNDSLGSMEKMAAQVGKALAATFTIAAAGQAARQLLDYADNVVNVAEKTKFSTDAVQELTLAFQPHGIAIDAVATANEKLSKNLIGGDKSTVAALEKMHLNVAKLKTMAPDQLFITVADAIGKIKNPAEQAYVAMTVFGKGGSELLAGLDGHLKETTESFKAMGLVIDEKTIKAADDFGDQLGLMGKQLLGLIATVIGPLLPALSALGNALTWIGQNVIGPVLNVAIKFAITILGEFYTVIADVLGGLLSLGAKLPGGVGQKFAEMAAAVKASSASTTQYINGLWKETDKVATSAPKAAAAVVGFGGDLEEAARKAKEYQEALERITSFGNTTWQDTLSKMDTLTVAYGLHLLQMGAAANDVKIVLHLTEGQMKALEQQQKFLTAALDATTKQLQAQHQILGLMVPRFSEFHGELTGIDEETGNLHATLIDSETAMFSFTNQMEDNARKTETGRDALEHYRTTLQKLGDGARASLGGLNDIFQRAFEGGGGVGGAVSSFATNITSNLLSAIPVIGPAVSQFAGAIVSGIKKIFGGPSQDELAARDTFAKFQQQYGSLQQTIDAVGAAYEKAGKTGVEAQQALQRALDATHISAEAEKTALDEINGVINQGKQDQADLQAAVDRYKFSIEELGPAMQKQKLDEQAQQLVKDWTLLVGSGISVSTVNDHMAASMNDYLGLARQTGQEVPMAMQPIIQKMIDQGLVTDAAGHKITDMKDLGVTFSMTMSEGFKLVADKLQTLLEKLGLVPAVFDDMKNTGVDAADAVADAINKIPKHIETVLTVSGGGVASGGGGISSAVTETASNLDAWYALPFEQRINTTFDEWVKTHHASMGGVLSASGVQRFGGGGVVLPFTPRGVDTVPLMGAPGEMMLTQGQQARLFRMANGEGGGSVANLGEVRAELQAMRAQAAADARRLPERLAMAVAGAMATERGRR